MEDYMKLNKKVIDEHYGLWTVRHADGYRGY